MSTELWEQVEREFLCDHADSVVLTLYQKRDGQVEYRRQCQVCGKTVETVKRLSLTEAERAAAIPHGLNLAGQWYEAKRIRFKELCKQERSERDSEWWAQYNDYLASREWQDKRARVMDRDGHTCQACLRRRATEVHHLTYKHVFSEPLFDLIAICKTCHEALTAQSREGQEAAS